MIRKTLIIALFAMGSGSANTGWGFVKPMEEADAASDFEKAGTRLARRCRRQIRLEAGRLVAPMEA